MVDRVRLYNGDCLDVLKTLETASVDAIVTDPPAGIGFMGKTWDSFPIRDRTKEPGAARQAKKFHKGLGNGFDGVARSPAARNRFIAFLSAVFVEARRVIKPGGYALVWAIPRTSHWTATALEDAGWEIRDRISHLFGQGFPKGKGCLKPACEDWWLCRAPGKGVRPLGIDECRIEGPGWVRPNGEAGAGFKTGKFMGVAGLGEPTQTTGARQSCLGRWPANLCLSHHPECVPCGSVAIRSNGHYPAARGKGGNGTAGHAGQAGLEERHTDGETVEAYDCHPDCPVRLLDEQAGPQKSGGTPPRRPPTSAKTKNAYGTFDGEENPNGIGRSAGAVSRFFYCPKASRSDRGEGNTHPTVKPTKLMEWLVKLVCPPGGVCLDPFAGSGTTGVACVQTGRKFIGVELDPTYFKIAEKRIAEAEAQAAGEAGPLFAAAKEG